MGENPLPVYNVFGDCDALNNANDIVRLVLDEQLHNLTEEDRQILRDRENLRNEFHTLQNITPAATVESTVEFPASTTKQWDLIEEQQQQLVSVASSKSVAAAVTTPADDVYFVDVEAIVEPPASVSWSCGGEAVVSEYGGPLTNTDVDNTIANFIQDETVKAEVLRLNEQIEINSFSVSTLSAEAKTLLVERLRLKRKLEQVERKIATFSVEDAKVKHIKRKRGADCASTGHSKRTYFYRFGAPYFKTKERFPCDRNADLMEITLKDQPMMLRLPRVRRFRTGDADFLDSNVLAQLKAKRVEQLRKCLQLAESRLKDDPQNEVYVENIRRIEKTIEETAACTQVCDTVDWNIPVDYMALPNSSRFTTEDYERIWKLTGSPALSRAEFSKSEIEELRQLVDKYRRQDWDRIAGEMSTNRSGFMCFTKYAAVEKKGKNQPWTKEENDLLYSLCLSMDFMSQTDSRYQFWKSIRCHFPHRSYSQIHSHWMYVLKPRIKKGRFTKAESRLMLTLLEKGKTYREIAQIVQNRNVNQIRTHFEAVEYTQKIRGGCWTADEEEQLLRLVDKYGSHDWSSISKEMGTRNRTQCRLKYMLFLRNDHRFLHNRTPKDFWSAEENRRFKEMLLRYGCDFRRMSEEMPSKTQAQYRYKFHRSKRLDEYRNLMAALNLGDKAQHRRSEWTADEVELFKQLLVKYGPRFTKIAPFLATKTVTQMRCKYFRMKREWDLPHPAVANDVCVVANGYGDLTVKAYRRPAWTVDEIDLLKRLLVQYGTQFTKIATLLAPKTVGQIRRKYHSMKNEWNLPVPEAGQGRRFVTATGGEVKSAKGKGVRRRKKATEADASAAEANGLLAMQQEEYVVTGGQLNQQQQRSSCMEQDGRAQLLPALSPEQILFSAVRQELLQLASTSSRGQWLASAMQQQSLLSAAAEERFPPAELFANSIAASRPNENKNHQPQDSAGNKSARSRRSSRIVLWTDEEVELLKRYLLMFGPDYKKISELMPAKSRNQVRNKYKWLKGKWNVPLPALSKKGKNASRRVNANASAVGNSVENSTTSTRAKKSRKSTSAMAKVASAFVVDAATDNKRTQPQPGPKKRRKSSSAASSVPTSTSKPTEGLQVASTPAALQTQHRKRLLAARNEQQPLPVELFKSMTAVFDRGENPSFGEASAVRPPSAASPSNCRDHSDEEFAGFPDEVYQIPPLYRKFNGDRCEHSDDEFTGFPDKPYRVPQLYRKLVPVKRIKTCERLEEPGLSCEQMIVPETVLQMCEEMRASSFHQLRSRSKIKRNGRRKRN